MKNALRVKQRSKKFTKYSGNQVVCKLNCHTVLQKRNKKTKLCIYLYISYVYFYLSKNFTHVLPNQNGILQFFSSSPNHNFSGKYFLFIQTILQRLFITMDLISFLGKKARSKCHFNFAYP